VLRSGFTDHFSLILNINIDVLNIQNTNNNNVLNIKFKKIDFKHLNMLIKIEDCNTLLENKNVNSSVDIFYDKINYSVLASSNY